jgi:hypothetical protein
VLREASLEAARGERVLHAHQVKRLPVDHINAGLCCRDGVQSFENYRYK